MIKPISRDAGNDELFPAGTTVSEAPSMDSLSQRAIDVVVSVPVEVTPAGPSGPGNPGGPTPPSEDFDA